MVEVMSGALRRPSVPLAILLVAAIAISAQAHRLDEYLQATLVDIEPGDIRLQINLTPGMQVADKVLAVIDQNHDGVISPAEAVAYADLLKRDLTVRIDQRPLEPKLVKSEFPQAPDLQSGWGIIQIEYSLAPGPLSAGKHRLTLENRHMTGLGVYLFNAAQPRSQAIQITTQKRNDTQSLGEIEFAVQGSEPPTRVVTLIALSAVVIIIAVAALRPRRKGVASGNEACAPAPSTTEPR
jgi:hypothetical protein